MTGAHSQSNEFSFQDLHDRSDLIVGRSHDFKDIDVRIRRSGVTFVSGVPRCGKSWLVTEWARTRMLSPGFAIGLHHGGPYHALLYAIQDLWRRWYFSGPFKQQATAIVNYLRKKDNLSKISSFGILAEELISIINNPSEKAAKSLFSGTGLLRFLGHTSGALSRLEADVSHARAYIQPATCSQVLGLLDIITNASERRPRMVLIVDAWEHSEHKPEEDLILRGLLERSDELPFVHVIIAHRVDSDEKSSKTLMIAQSLEREYSNCAVLDASFLRLNKEEENMLIKRLRKCSRALSELDDSVISSTVNSYAGAIDAIIRERPVSAEDLAQTQNNIRRRKYGDIEHILNTLSPQMIRSTAAALLIPYTINRDDWLLMAESFKAILDEADINQLRSLHVLSNKEPYVPDWEHEDRQRTALSWYLKNARGTLTESIEKVITSVAALLLPFAETYIPAAKILLYIYDISDKLNLDRTIKDFTLLPFLFVDKQHINFVVSEETVFNNSDKLDRLIKQYPNLTQVLSFALINIDIVKAQDMDIIVPIGLPRIRSFYEHNQSDSLLCIAFAVALHNHFNVLFRRGEVTLVCPVLEELWLLSRRHPSIKQVGTATVASIFEYLIAIDKDAVESEIWFSRLQHIQTANPNDEETAYYASKAMCNHHVHYLRNNTFDKADDMLENIRSIHAHFDDHSEIKGTLALALYNKLVSQRSTDTIVSLVNELSALALTKGADYKITECYIKGIWIGYMKLLDVKKIREAAGFIHLLHSLSDIIKESLEKAKVWIKTAACLMWFITSMKRELWDDLTNLIEPLNSCIRLYPNDAVIRQGFLISLIGWFQKADELGIQLELGKVYDHLWGTYSVDVIPWLANVLYLVASTSDPKLSIRALSDLQVLAIEYPQPCTGTAAVYLTLLRFTNARHRGDLNEACGYADWLSKNARRAEESSEVTHIISEQCELFCRAPKMWIETQSFKSAVSSVLMHFVQHTERIVEESNKFLKHLDIVADETIPRHVDFSM